MSAKYGLSSVKYGLSSAKNGLSSAKYGRTSAVYGCDKNYPQLKEECDSRFLSSVKYGTPRQILSSAQNGLSGIFVVGQVRSPTKIKRRSAALDPVLFRSRHGGA
ncbi:hypothetical protein C8J34_12221 [Rhizobium sp. PP-F2F-G36]|nr:hypothetical protein C8J34_12221 [Rhizobium sp. PP-F2F-G36]